MIDIKLSGGFYILDLWLALNRFSVCCGWIGLIGIYQHKTQRELVLAGSSTVMIGG